jgi:hypothetical protein
MNLIPMPTDNNNIPFTCEYVIREYEDSFSQSFKESIRSYNVTDVYSALYKYLETEQASFGDYKVNKQYPFTVNGVKIGVEFVPFQNKQYWVEFKVPVDSDWI